MANDTLGGAPTSSRRNETKMPEIAVANADSSAAELLAKQNSNQSPVLSYVHTPAEQYGGDINSTAAGGLQQLGVSGKAGFNTSEATAATLQAEIDGAAMVPGSVWYLVARKWFAEWQESASGLVQCKIGPIDNSGIVDANGELQPELRLGEDLEAVPLKVWQKMSILYGIKDQQNIIRRVAVQSDTEGQAVLDLYPPSVFVVSKDAFVKADTKNVRRIVISSGASLAELKIQICHKLGVNSPSGIKLFRSATERASDSVSMDTLQSPPSYESAITSERDLDLNIGSGNTAADQLEEIKDDDSTLLMAAGILSDSTVVFDPCLSLRNQAAALADDELASDTNSTGLTVMVDEMMQNWEEQTTKLSSSSSDMKVSDAENTASNALVHSTPAAQVHYLCGLNNLGNTCFMNSALQCLGHFSDLTQYFVSNVYRTELNRDNPLGMKGAVASAYGRLVKAMWDIGRGAYAPRMFKQTVAQWAPQFRGYNQQDAPEFLAFLLDGMHEDLNRIISKPYIEVPDANGRPDAEVADEQWDIYKRRNDSVVVDLFQGQYRSTLVCPECSHVSVTFDPFMYLTLPLPIQRQKWIQVLFIPADTNVYATHMHLLARKEDTVKQLKQLVAHLVQCDATRLLACDIFSMRMYSVFTDSDSLGDIRDSDIVHMYEVGIDTAKAAADPASEPSSIVQLLCSRPSSPSPYGSYSYGPDLATKPLMLTLPTEEMTLGELYLKIASVLSRWAVIDMSRVISQLQQVGKSSGSDERLLELLGKAACLSVHRASSSSSSYGQYRNLASISSYMYTGRRNFGSPNAFRAFEDRITNDSCESLTAAKEKPAQANETNTNYGKSAGNVLTAGTSAAAAGAEGSGRRRARDDLEHDEEWDSSSDNDGDYAMRGTPKRARSDNESDGETQSTTQVTPLFTPKDTELEDVDFASSEPRDHAAGDRETIQDSSDDEMATATAALSFADLMGTKVSFKTGDTLLCEWSAEGTKALLAELGSNQEDDVDLLGKMFDFDKVTEFAMPSLDDATQYKDVEPIEPVSLKESPQTASRPSGGSKKQKQVTLEDCLTEFTRSEQLGEEDLWYCSKCQEHQQATKKFDLWRVPEILVVHLKRFQHSRAWRDKIDVFVDFPLTDLDLTQNMCGPNDENLVYDLYSVCNHYGGMGGGHYTAYARNPEDGKWYNFDDSHVSPVSDPESVKTAAAYMLFYRLRSSTGDSATAKIEKLIADYKEAGEPASAADDDMNMSSNVSMQSPLSSRLMDDGNSSDDYSMGIDRLTARRSSESDFLRPCKLNDGDEDIRGLSSHHSSGNQSPRSDMGNASEMEANSSPSTPTAPSHDTADIEFSSLL
ncbi:hypothetical protein IWW36_001872 [Coemansia brasiliensis]|uniref:ubiquitinyl hydrolase 1 n=1 Tax=Coemansia brasiliensis TaxID=2650707 RepID=A0A9W8M164_9FUNG|nr:hypothetical protein IWW36_001872 [Coemansia brasiliensis]